MNTKRNQYIFILISFVLAFGLYWPALNGLAIWDDSTFFYDADYMSAAFSNLIIWKYFNWPISVLSQKFLLQLWGHHYFYYHLLSLFIHFLNSFLLLKLSERLRLPFSKFIFLFFLFHPANVISVSWIIQFKTLSCFTFAIISFLCLFKAEDKKRFYFFSILFFILSILSKSSSLPLPFIFLIFYVKRIPNKQLLWLVPFFLLSLGSGYRVLTSTTTAEGVMKLKSKGQETVQVQGQGVAQVQGQGPAQIQGQTSSQAHGQGAVQGKDLKGKEEKGKEAHQKELTKLKKTTVVKKSLPPAPKPLNMESLITKLTTDFFQTFHRVLSISHYYFWQTFLPLHTQPVKGMHYSDHNYEYYLHLFFLVLVTILTFGSRIFYILLSGYIMLMPFLGFLLAPFMNITWVSDQHLYLAMPFFICFSFELLDKLKWKWARYTPYLFLAFFIFKLGSSTAYYRNEITFYEASLEADPTNVPIGYNLVVAYLGRRDLNSALNIAESFVHMAEISHEIKSNKFYPEMFLLYSRLQPRKPGSK